MPPRSEPPRPEPTTDDAHPGRRSGRSATIGQAGPSGALSTASRPASARIASRVRRAPAIAALGLCLLAIAGIVPSSAWAVSKSVVSFGADPADSATDDTQAMQLAANWLCSHPGTPSQPTTLVYPNGVYNVDSLVGVDAEYAPDVSGKAITYTNCRNVTITGTGARIEVKGDFTKSVHSIDPTGPLFPLCHGSDWPTSTSPCASFGYADLFQRTPFAFQNSDHVLLTGFEINGNVDATTQSDPSVYFQEGDQHGIWTINTNNLTVRHVFVHQMGTDGILLGSARPGDNHIELDHVQSANNDRNALSIVEAHDVKVIDSSFTDSGQVGTAIESYAAHSGNRGVAVEPECLPADADWGAAALRSPDCRLTGNILFQRITTTGNLGGPISIAHGESTANVTVRDSLLRNPTGKGGPIDIGIAGGVLANSNIDLQQGTINPCLTAADVAQTTSTVYARYLTQLADEPTPTAGSIYRERRGLSSTLQGNSITGQGTLVRCEQALPFLTITGNHLRGAQQPDAAQDPNYAIFGYLFLAGRGCVQGGPGWSQDAYIKANSVFIPATAPRKAEGEIVYCGEGIHLANNTYTTDSVDPANHLTVRYDHVAPVTNDCFPTTATIVAIHGPTRPGDPPDYPAWQPYPLTPTGCLNNP